MSGAQLLVYREIRFVQVADEYTDVYVKVETKPTSGFPAYVNGWHRKAFPSAAHVIDAWSRGEQCPVFWPAGIPPA